MKAVLLPLALAVGLYISVPAPLLHAESIDLGGVWLTQRLQEPVCPPADASGWVETDVVAPVAASPWVCQRREILIPRTLEGRHLFLRFEGVKYTAQVSCNGKAVGQHVGGYEPFECDITDVAKLGEANVIEVLAGSWRQLTTDPAAASDSGLGRAALEENTDWVLYPIGSHHSMGIWAPVTLESRPDTYIDDVFVTTSVRERRLRVEVTVRHLGSGPAAFTLRQHVRRGDRQLLQLQETGATIAAEGTDVLVATQPWPDPPLWWPHDPVLLHLDTELLQNGKAVHRQTTRFGFREIWTDGPLFVLNGTPMHMLGNSCHPLGYTRDKARQTYELCRAAHINCFRLHAQPWGKAWYDIADETGMLIVHETAVWCYVRQYALGDERFWSNFAAHIRGQIKQHRNRPSVISWSLENEILHCGGSRVPATEQRLVDLATVARDVDPTRLLNYDGDEDPKGAADMVNLHYPNEFPTVRNYPDGCWWLDREHRVQGWPRREWLWDRQKPLYIGEYLWSPSSTPDRYTVFFGDDAYLDLSHYRVAGKATAWRYQIEAYRAQGLSGGCPWNIFEGGKLPDSPMYQAVKTGYRPQCAITRDWSDMFFPGQTFTRRITFINDVLRPAKLQARLECRADGQVADAMTLGLPLGPAEIRAEQVGLRAPDAQQETAFEFVVTLSEGGKEVFREVRPCRVIPAEPVPGVPPGKLAVFDPVGDTQRVLGEAGVTLAAVADLSAVPRGTACLLIGEDAFSEGEAPMRAVVGAADDRWGAFNEFVQDGGTAIVLAQSFMPPHLAVTAMTNGSTMAFVRRPDHPLVAGCTHRDFRFWKPDHLLSRNDLLRPSQGENRIIIDAGDDGMNRVLLMESRRGSGRIIFCQLLLTDRVAEEPVARRLLLRLLSYGTAASTRPDPRPLAVLSSNPQVAAALKAAGAVTTTGTGELTNVSALLVDSDHPAALSARARLDRWVADGGLVWLHAPSAAYLDKLGLSRQAMSWQEAATAPVHAALSTGFGAGVRHEDLYWLSDSRPTRHQAWAQTPDITNHVLRPALVEAHATVIPAPQLDNSTVKITRRSDDGIWLATSGTVTARINVEAKGNYVIGVMAGGSPMGGVFPAYRVMIGAETVGGFTAVSAAPRLYTVSAPLEAGEHELGISFVNDASNPPEEDRNALVASALVAPALALPGDVIPLTEPAALYLVKRGKGHYLVDGLNWHVPGALNVSKAQRLLRTLLGNAGVALRHVSSGTPIALDGFELQPDVTHVEKRSGGIIYLGNTAWTQGTVEFAKSATYQVIVDAKGTEANGEFPEIELSVDGNVVEAKQLSSTGWHETVYTTAVAEGEHVLRLRFTNDYYDPAQHLDRNLWIRRLAVAVKD